MGKFFGQIAVARLFDNKVCALRQIFSFPPYSSAHLFSYGLTQPGGLPTDHEQSEPITGLVLTRQTKEALFINQIWHGIMPGTATTCFSAAIAEGPRVVLSIKHRASGSSNLQNISAARCLSTKAVKSAALALQRVHNVHGGDGLAASVLLQ
jgi:hypothetical protein